MYRRQPDLVRRGAPAITKTGCSPAQCAAATAIPGVSASQAPGVATCEPTRPRMARCFGISTPRGSFQHEKNRARWIHRRPWRRVVNGMVYVNSGYARQGEKCTGNVLLAFAPGE